MAKHQGLGRGFGEFFQRTDLESEESRNGTDVSRETAAPLPPGDVPAASPSDPSSPTSASGPAERADGAGASAPPRASSQSGGSVLPRAWEPGTTHEASVRTTPHGISSGTSAERPAQAHLDGAERAAATAVPGASVPPLSDGSRLQLVPVSRIHPNPKQPRRVFDESALLELSESIAEVGLLQPVVVSPDGDGYELVMGERRWRASRLAGLDTIPAIIRATEAQDLLRDALLENLHRSQLNPLEEAAAYQQMLEDFGCTQEELSKRIKRSRPQIANTLRLMKLPRTVQRSLLDGALTAGHARALLSLTNREDQEHIADRIVDEGLSVRATERLVQNLTNSRTQVKPHMRNKPGADEEAMQIASRLADVYDTDVRIKRTKGKGRGTIVLSFEDNEDLDRIMGILEGPKDASTHL